MGCSQIVESVDCTWKEVLGSLVEQQGVSWDGQEKRTRRYQTCRSEPLGNVSIPL